MKAQALETATGMVPLIVGVVVAIVTMAATQPMGMGVSFLYALVASMAVYAVGVAAMRAAYMPVVVALKAAADQDTAAHR